MSAEKLERLLSLGFDSIDFIVTSCKQGVNRNQMSGITLGNTLGITKTVNQTSGSIVRMKMGIMI